MAGSYETSPVGGGSRPRWICIEPVESLTLPDKKRPNALPWARIDLGRYGASWVNSIGFQQQGGDCWGCGEPMGHDEGSPPRVVFPTRDAALADAMDRMRRRIGSRSREMAPQLAWLDGLAPDQLDLFGLAA